MNWQFGVFVCMLVSLVWDLRQTLAIADNPSRWYERNPILGEHPEKWIVWVWFLAILGFSVLAFVFLPSAWGTTYCGCVLVAEVVCVINNLKLGIK